MPFLVYPGDFKIASRDEIVKAVVRQDDASIQLAIDVAIEEMSSYLSNRFDVTNIFNKVGDERNKLIVIFGADIALYHLYSGLSKQQIPEEKKNRYDRAIEWLKDVCNGDVSPTGLPLLTSDTSTDVNNPVKFGNSCNNSEW